MNKTSLYQFTIVIPVYNEEENMPRLEEKMKEYLPHALYKACVLFVNDGSTDNSLKCIREICKRNEDFYYISYPKNAGPSAAMKAGFETAESPYVGYIDADLQTNPEDFNLLLKDAPDYALVTGIRTKRNDSNAISRFVQSRIGNGFRRMMTHDGVEDTCCPLKVLHTDYAKRMPLFTGMHRFVAALILLQDGGSVKQIPVRHYPRIAGKAKFNLWNRLIPSFLDCFAYRWMMKRYINYHISESDLSEKQA